MRLIREIRDEFLAFLYDKKSLNEKQVEKILDIQNHEKPSVGTLSKELGYLTALDVMEIIQIQISISNKKYFGEIAIELGKLSEERVNKLLKLQLDRVPTSKEIISRNKILSTSNLKKFYDKFKAEK